MLNLESYRASLEDMRTVLDVFHGSILRNVDLFHLTKQECERCVPFRSGCYLYLMEENGQYFRIYVGQASNLARRLVNYISEFQPQSINDYKMRFFQEAMNEWHPYAVLNLYWVETPIDSLNARETELIRQFRPFINHLRRPSAEEKDVIRTAYRSLYRSLFQF